MKKQVDKIHTYLLAFNEILHERQASGLLPVYDAGFVNLDKQYLTVGINGLIESAESLGIDINLLNQDYIAYTEAVLQPMRRMSPPRRCSISPAMETSHSL